ncbi:hypothetical protein PTKIN_Ptkin14bG0029200 [Pterospermum kingtungense]
MWCFKKTFQLLCLSLFFLTLSSSSSSVTPLCSHNEASALIQFKSSFSISETSSWYCDYFAGIKSYPKTDSWTEDTDCCSWDGVTCDAIKGHVIGLDLSCSWLYGTIPSNSSLFRLPHLQKLNLAFNNFNHSKMSSMFVEFASLEYLNLSASSFAGQVPSEVSHLSKLVSLDLSRKYYQHLDLFGNDYQALELDKHTLEGLVHDLTEVRQLVLDGTNMSSVDPNVLMNLSSSLGSLSLYDCSLQGKLPESIFHLPNLKLLNLGSNVNLGLSLPKFIWSSQLEFLDLSFMPLSRDLFESIGKLVSLEHLELIGANISGSIPTSLGNLRKLKYLNLRHNSLSGQIPPSLIRNLTQLEFLDFGDNQLEGSIPDDEEEEEVSVFPNLVHLDLSYNLFNGSLPSCMYTIHSLKYIYLSGSHFSGEIKEFQYNNSLEYIDLSSNNLQGPIPSSISQLLNLTSLDLSSNKIQGPIPSSISQLKNLISLFLSSNELQGPIPSSTSQLLNLNYLDLSSNKLQGPIPSSISQLLNLTSLYLSSNNLSGIVEIGMFSKLQNLQSLDLSSNSLSLISNGTGVDYTLPNLQYLDLSSCNVSEFPQFLRGSKSLMSLDLSNNRIHEKVPMWMQDVGKETLSYLNLSHNSLTDIEQLPLKAIRYLDLSSNFIHGDLPIPTWATHVFFISNNRLSGEISSPICNASSLQLLDLSHNNLSGIIPQCLGSLSKRAQMLNLQMNRFHGIIPPTFPAECQLMILNLNGNQLEGPLARSILNCTSLEVLDLGNNKIKDTFPHWLGNLRRLRVLVLRSNQLQGSIDDARSNLSFSKIQIFDVSSNNFTGTLPVRYIKNFKAMINLTNDETATQYMGMSDAGSFYSFTVGIAIKGVDMEVLKIFTKLSSIDLSNNKFEGEIPEVIGKLSSLKGLNLSHNNLSGSIPFSIGNLTNLEWLDLSSNKLVGTIPESLLNLIFLSVFNVSKNQLEGHIPQGKQFNTFGNSSYEGNKGLCGFPVSKGCSNNEPPPSNLLEEDGSGSNISFGWRVVFMGYGCGVVFGLAMGYVVFRTSKPKWFVTMVEDWQSERRSKKVS